MSREYSASIIWSDEDSAYVAVSPEFGSGVSAFGDTVAEAAQELATALDLEIETSERAGEPLPDPRVFSTYSGKTVVRLGSELHRLVAGEAERSGISLNSTLLSLISLGLGRSMERQRAADTAKSRRVRPA